jgi:hypothetical protein
MCEENYTTLTSDMYQNNHTPVLWNILRKPNVSVYSPGWMGHFGPVSGPQVVLHPLFVGSFLPLYSKFTRSFMKKNTGARRQNAGRTEYPEGRQEEASKERRALRQGSGSATGSKENNSRIQKPEVRIQ